MKECCLGTRDYHKQGYFLEFISRYGEPSDFMTKLESRLPPTDPSHGHFEQALLAFKCHNECS